MKLYYASKEKLETIKPQHPGERDMFSDAKTLEPDMAIPLTTSTAYAIAWALDKEGVTYSDAKNKKVELNFKTIPYLQEN